MLNLGEIIAKVCETGEVVERFEVISMRKTFDGRVIFEITPVMKKEEAGGSLQI